MHLLVPACKHAARGECQAGVSCTATTSLCACSRVSFWHPPTPRPHPALVQVMDVPDEWRPLPMVRIYGLPAATTEDELAELLAAQQLDYAVHRCGGQLFRVAWLAGCLVQHFFSSQPLTSSHVGLRSKQCITQHCLPPSLQRGVRPPAVHPCQQGGFRAL